MKFRRSLSVPTLLIAALHLLACGSGDRASDSTPTPETGDDSVSAGGSGSGGGKTTSGKGSVGIRSFEAEAEVVEFGESVTLSWEIEGEPDELLLDGEDVLGKTSIEVVPERRQRFELTARFGSETFSETVEVAARGIALLAGSERGAGNANGDLDSAQFRSPAAVAYDKAGNLYVSDYRSCTVRKIDVEGNVSTVAGDPLACDGEDGKGSDAHFGAVLGLIVDSSGVRSLADEKVSLFAGTPGADEPADGPSEKARSAAAASWCARKARST